MSYQILGALRVVPEGAEAVVDVPGAQLNACKVQTLLATLLIRANEVVSTDQLTAELWGEEPPRRAMAGLHVYVSQLRKHLVAVTGKQPLLTRPPGYLIQVGSDELDLLVFRRWVQHGRTRMRAGRFDEASVAFRTALGLFRGPVLIDLRNGEVISRFVAWLDELRLECTEMLVASDFELGRHQELVGFLSELVSEHPLHEAFHRQLMLALYRCDRRADALQVYHAARETLTRELGLEPCRSLREMHRSILVDDGEPLAV
jgi:DNA-binding SARP family transcriptional activator